MPIRAKKSIRQPAENAPVYFSAVDVILSASAGTLLAESRVMFFTAVARGTASVAGGRQLTALVPSTQEWASGHGFGRQSS